MVFYIIFWRERAREQQSMHYGACFGNRTSGFLVHPVWLSTFSTHFAIACWVLVRFPWFFLHLVGMVYSDLQNCLNVLQFCVSMPISQSDLHQITWLKMRWKAVLLEFPTHVQSRNLDKIWWICQLFFDLNALRQFCNCYLIPHPHRLPLWNFVSGGGNKLCNCYNGPTVILLRL